MSDASGENLGYIFLKKRHIRYFLRCLEVLPSRTSSYDTSRMTILFFALSGLDILGALEEVQAAVRTNIIEWIYSLQVVVSDKNSRGGFKGGNVISFIDDGNASSCVSELDGGHIAMTYTALASLILLGDDLSRVDRKGIQNHMRSLQRMDGSFYSVAGGSENDIRFVYCAATVCYMLQDFGGMNVDAATQFILNSLTYEGAFGQGPSQESHAGPTYCAVAALDLMGKLNALSQNQRDRLVRWLILRQDAVEGGFKGRPNKLADTCYTFWVGAALAILGEFHNVDQKPLVKFVMATQDPIIGGLGKHEGVDPDGLHSYLGISGLSLVDQNLNLELGSVEPSLNISQRAFKYLKTLHKRWLNSS